MDVLPVARRDWSDTLSHGDNLAGHVVTGDERQVGLVGMPDVLADPDVETVHRRRADSDQHFACGRRRVRPLNEPKDLRAAVLGDDDRAHQYAIQPPSTSRLIPLT